MVPDHQGRQYRLYLQFLKKVLGMKQGSRIVKLLSVS